MCGIAGVFDARGGIDPTFVERQVRTAVATTIYGGTSEIQRDIIAKTYGL